MQSSIDHTTHIAHLATADPGVLSRVRKDARGTTAVEFGLVAGPFFLLMLGIITVGLHYFTITSLEYGVAAAARKIRTGEAQTQNMTVASFRQLVCDEAGSYVACDGNLVIHLKRGATFADLDPPISCLTNGNLTPSGNTAANAVSTYSGAASATVLVTACYNWQLGFSLWRSLWSLLSVTPTSGDKTIISATTTFRTEPYN
ncbi:MAG: TadE/TadG family type IV pilus assembly protein [Hyphomicrobium sp.]